jgi:hypothetical protein
MTMGKLHLLACMLLLAAPAFAQGSTANTPTCPAGTQVTTPGSTSDPKLAATQGVGRAPPKGSPAPAAPPDPAANTAVRVGNGLARLPDGTLCRPLGG